MYFISECSAMNDTSKNSFHTVILVNTMINNANIEIISQNFIHYKCACSKFIVIQCKTLVKRCLLKFKTIKNFLQKHIFADSRCLRIMLCIYSLVGQVHCVLRAFSHLHIGQFIGKKTSLENKKECLLYMFFPISFEDLSDHKITVLHFVNLHFLT